MLVLALVAVAAVGSSASASTGSFASGSCDATGTKATTYAKTTIADSERTSCFVLHAQLHLATNSGGHRYDGPNLASAINGGTIIVRPPAGSYIVGSKHQCTNTGPDNHTSTLEL